VKLQGSPCEIQINNQFQVDMCLCKHEEKDLWTDFEIGHFVLDR